MGDNSSPSLLSTNRNSDSTLAVQLHPLVILTISDYITRHVLRQQDGPIVGAIIGAQNGRDITMEHAFECKLEQGKDGETLIDAGWFHDRLQQYRDVHKATSLDFVAWFTLAPPSGPQREHLPIHSQLLQNYNESILLLTLHPSSVSDGTSKGGKLPLSIYETIYEIDGDNEDKQMQSSGQAAQLVLRFQELPYTIETGEAEMIGIDFVARGGTNSAVAKVEALKENSGAGTSKTTKGKERSNIKERSHTTNGDSNSMAEGSHDVLSPEDEELIASLTAKANAIRMLQQRVTLIKTYLQSLPPCYLNTALTPGLSNTANIEAHPQISHPILRTIASLLARLPLLISSSSTTPASSSTHTGASTHLTESLTSRTDVSLTSLLGSMGTTLRSAQEMGRKAGIVEHARAAAAAKSAGPTNLSSSSNSAAAARRMVLGQGGGVGNINRGASIGDYYGAEDGGEGVWEGEEDASRGFGGGAR